MHLLLFFFVLAQQTLSAPDNGTVTGVLRNGAGKPAAGVRVAAMAPPGTAEDVLKGTALVSLDITNSEGRYRLENIPPGRYYISAGRVDTPTYFPGTLELASGRVVVLSSAAAVTDVDFVLKDQSLGRAVSELLFLLPLNPGLSVPVSVSIEGGGKVPTFSNGSYPFVQLTDVLSGKTYDSTFSREAFVLPIPTGSATDEYHVSVMGLPDGYSLRSLRFGSADVQSETLKISRSGLTIMQSRNPGESAVSPAPISLVLSAATPVSGKNGVRVAGRSIGSGDEIYLENAPGTLFSDGTFEFREVPPGLHLIVKYAGGNIHVASLFVGNRDVEDVRLQSTSVIPGDIFSDKPRVVAGNAPDPGQLPMVSLHGRIVDEVSKEPLSGGTITFSGFPGSRRVFVIDGDGRFEINQLLPGAYNIAVRVADYASVTRAVTIGVEDLNLDLTARREPAPDPR